MKDSGAFVPEEPVEGMPVDLAAAIYELDEDIVPTILQNWAAIGDEGREQYRQYLNRAHFRHSRHERCQLAALQLYEPDRPFQVPNTGGF